MDRESIENFNTSILSISEFKARFNSNLNDPRLRKYDIASLFSRSIKVPGSELELFISQMTGDMSAFVKGVELTTNSLMAKIHYQGTYKGGACTSQLLLQKRTHDNRVWWELIDFGAPFLDSLFARDRRAFIPPHAEELNFAVLTTDRPGNAKRFTSYLPENFRADPLSVLATLVSTGQLKLQYASRTQLYITELKGWILTLEHDTSGWKITALQPAHETSKILSLKAKN
jgi:hypothetical protein